MAFSETYYKKGLDRLRSCVETIADPDEKQEAKNELATLGDRLKNNLRSTRIYGSSENNRTERSQVIAALNEMAMTHCQGTTFTDLCEGKGPAPAPAPAPAPPDENVRQQQERLQENRQNLKHFLSQKTKLGGDAFAPPHVMHGIREARAEIARIKTILRGLGVAVEDHPDDGDMPSPPPIQIHLTESEHRYFQEQLGPGIQRYAIEQTKDPIRLTLRFRPEGEKARIQWDSPHTGSSESVFLPPYAGENLRVVIKALDSIQDARISFSPEEHEILKRYGLIGESGFVREDANEIIGRKLYETLTEDRAAFLAIKGIANTAINEGRSIAYVLRFPEQAVELAALPWETLWDDRQALLLSRGGREVDSIERYLELARAIPPQPPEKKKLHILALSPHFAIAEEERSKEQEERHPIWNDLKEKGLLDWDELSPVTAVSLADRLRRGPTPDIIHYFGHGTYNNGKGSLLFDHHARPGNADPVDVHRLSAILGDMRLIVLQACQSAMVADTAQQGKQVREGLFTGIAPALSVISQAVVAMQLKMPVTSAIQFQRVFYEEIGRGRSLQSAVADARRTLYVIENEGASWHIPTLYIRSREQEPVFLVRP